MTEPGVLVVIVSHNTRELTLRAIESVLDSDSVRVDVHVVDNASNDGSVDAVRARFPEVRIDALPRNVGFGRGNNVALHEVDHPFVLLFNSDATFAGPGGLRALVDALEEDATLGVVGPRLESPEGRLEYSARAFPGVLSELARGVGLHRLMPPEARSRTLALEFRDHSVAGPTDWLTGACLLFRRDVLDSVGGFDPAIFLYGEELDWCWRVREAGWGIRLVPDVVVVHRRGASGRRPEAWKVRLSMAGDAYVLKKHRGGGYLALFSVVRVAALAVQVVVQGVAGLVLRDDTRSDRASYSVTALRGWLSALIRGGARNPSERSLLPPMADGQVGSGEEVS